MKIHDLVVQERQMNEEKFNECKKLYLHLIDSLKKVIRENPFLNTLSYSETFDLGEESQYTLEMLDKFAATYDEMVVFSISYDLNKMQHVIRITYSLRDDQPF